MCIKSQDHSSTIDIAYHYYNDNQSRATGLVPEKLQLYVNGKPTTVFPLTLSASDGDVVCIVHLYATIPRKHPSSDEIEIINLVIDHFNLNELAQLCVLSSDLNNATLTVTYDLKDNTPEMIKARRIYWVIEKITAIKTSTAWGGRAKRERIKKHLLLNYFDEGGSPRSLKELEKMGRNV